METAKQRPTPVDEVRHQLEAAFEKQRAAFRAQPYPSYAERKKNVRTLIRLLVENREEIARAIDEDFGGRSRLTSLSVDVFVSASALKYAEKNLKKWMRPERRSAGLHFMPARARIVRQPLGVVGIISPWNYPIQLGIIPLGFALAAGNRAMLKPSELTPATSELQAKLLGEAFGEDLVKVVTGGPEVGQAFSSLPFDHLFYTGSTHVGRLVMRAASDNLTPVTLELGGKSPTIVHPSYPLQHAVERIVFSKLMNAGQTCVAADYVMIHESQRDAFVKAVEDTAGRFFPTIRENPEYTAIVNDRHHARIAALIADAKEKGAKVVEVNPANESFEGSRKMPLTLLLDVSDEMKVMQEEIFGPVLPVMTWKDLGETIDYVNDHPRPLALYYFDHDSSRTERMLRETHSGGVSVNETLLQAGVDDLPFGGVGASGMGAYHGIEGFLTFTHPKGVVYQSRLNGMGLFNPDSKHMERILGMLIGK